MDPFAAATEGRYEISSLYLDNDQFRLAGETLEGLRDRFKLRVRAYSDRPEDPVFLEVKQRRDGRISKERSRLDRGTLEQLFEKGEGRSLHPGEQPMLDGFLAKMLLIGAGPKALVRYERTAYRGVFDHDVRITFDRNIRTIAARRAGPFFERGGWLPVEQNQVVLEFKFNGRYPPWMVQAAQAVKLKRVSFSKYARAATIACDPASSEQAAF